MRVSAQSKGPPAAGDGAAWWVCQGLCLRDAKAKQNLGSFRQGEHTFLKQLSNNKRQT